MNEKKKTINKYIYIYIAKQDENVTMLLHKIIQSKGKVKQSKMDRANDERTNNETAAAAAEFFYSLNH